MSTRQPFLAAWLLLVAGMPTHAASSQGGRDQDCIARDLMARTGREGGRVYTIGTTELENNGTINGAPVGKHEYLTARDAFNGQILWKVDLESENDGGALISVNSAPLVAAAGKVIAYCKDRLVAFDGATGKRVTEYRVKHPTGRLLTLDGMLVTAGWGTKELAKEPEFSAGNGLWAPWTAPAGSGSVQAFEVSSGRETWNLPVAATDLLAADGNVYALCREKNPADAEVVLGLDLASGRQRWRLQRDVISREPWLHLNSAGAGVLAVVRLRDRKVSVLDGGSGKQLWEAAGGLRNLTPLKAGVDMAEFAVSDLQAQLRHDGVYLEDVPAVRAPRST